MLRISSEKQTLLQNDMQGIQPLLTQRGDVIHLLLFKSAAVQIGSGYETSSAQALICWCACVCVCVCVCVGCLLLHAKTSEVLTACT